MLLPSICEISADGPESECLDNVRDAVLIRNLIKTVSLDWPRMLCRLQLNAVFVLHRKIKNLVKSLTLIVF